MWLNIDPHLMLYAILPVLLFGDASSLNLQTMWRCFSQCSLLAGPGVLLSSFLTALLFKYGVLHDWSWEMAMMMGTILSATDPVAVVGLLKEMGASSKLTMIIAGESLMNDGVAIVVFTLFLNMYKNCSFGYWKVMKEHHRSTSFDEILKYVDFDDKAQMKQLEIDGDFNLCADFYICEECKEGEDYSAGEIVEFAFRMALGAVVVGGCFGLLLVALMECGRNDSVVQIALTIGAAYGAFFIAEHDAKMSGVLSCVAMACVFAIWAWPSVASKRAMHDVWHTLEFLGNMLIFHLSGLIMGIITYDTAYWGASDMVWGKLILLYLLITCVRFAVVFAFFPVLRLLGQGVTVAECVVVAWGGLRGAIGLALSITVYNTYGVDKTQAADVVFYACGIATLTLLINGSTSGFLLKRLGLIEPTKGELVVTKEVCNRVKGKFEKYYAELVAQPGFALHDPDEVKKFFSHLTQDDDHGGTKNGTTSHTDVVVDTYVHEIHMTTTTREVFLSALKAQYWRLIDKGFIKHGGAASMALLASVDSALERVVTRNDDLCDWHMLEEVLSKQRHWFRSAIDSYLTSFLRWFNVPTKDSEAFLHKVLFTVSEPGLVYVYSAFITAHKGAQKFLITALGTSDAYADTDEQKKVIAESDAFIELATKKLEALKKQRPEEVKMVQTWQCIRMVRSHLRAEVERYSRHGVLIGKGKEDLLHRIGVEGGH